MGIALGQQPKQRAEIAEARQRERARQQPPRSQVQGLDGVGAEMLVEPRAPDEPQRIARLHGGAEAARPGAAHEAHVSAVGPGHCLHDRGALAVASEPDHDALVTPFHYPALPRGVWRWRGGGALASRSATRIAAATTAPTRLATPGQPQRAKNRPPMEPTTLDPT